MAIVNYTMNPNEPLTKEQKEEIKRAKEMTDVYDEDCPPLTDEQLAELAAVARQQRANAKAQCCFAPTSCTNIGKSKKIGRRLHKRSKPNDRILPKRQRNPAKVFVR